MTDVIENIILGLVILTSLQHLAFMALEVFYWDKPLGRKVFRMSEDFAKQSKPLAVNQGFYNGFLAVALAVSVWYWGSDVGDLFKIFGLSCVVMAAVVGGLTISKRILYIQGGPATLALVLTLAQI